MIDHPGHLLPTYGPLSAPAIAHHHVMNIAAFSRGAGVERMWRWKGRRSRQRTSLGGVYQFADVTVDLDRFELQRAGVPQHVEPQVLEVLAYLIRHRDRLVTKQELMDQIWHDRFISDSAITSRIKAARRVTGDDGERQNVIRTVHGRGYRFIADVTAACFPS